MYRVKFEQFKIIKRWVAYYSPVLLGEFNKRKRKPGTRWRLDETYIRVKKGATTKPSGNVNNSRGVDLWSRELTVFYLSTRHFPAPYS